MSRKYIELPNNVLDFFHLTETKHVTVEKIVYNFEVYHLSNIQILAHKIKRMLGSETFDYEEIYNQILANTLSSIQDYLKLKIHKEGKEFSHYFWMNLKLKVLNYFNKNNNQQAKFERNLASNRYTKTYFNNLYIYLYQQGNLSKVYDYELLKQKVLAKLNEQERKFLTNYLKNENDDHLTTQKRNSILEKIKNKIIS
ncbi:hypothetical protein [Mycoplasma buteonis]|uniref:hypothetical protein n=1 Tax=Mycoplasma buteonis TaxID=171280 RepID=UPI00056A3FE6|nr:hypothetical protein [Mycoplasma buteonis]